MASLTRALRLGGSIGLDRAHAVRALALGRTDLFSAARLGELSPVHPVEGSVFGQDPTGYCERRGLGHHLHALLQTDWFLAVALRDGREGRPRIVQVAKRAEFTEAFRPVSAPEADDITQSLGSRRLRFRRGSGFLRDVRLTMACQVVEPCMALGDVLVAARAPPRTVHSDAGEKVVEDVGTKPGDEAGPSGSAPVALGRTGIGR